MIFSILAVFVLNLYTIVCDELNEVQSVSNVAYDKSRQTRGIDNKAILEFFDIQHNTTQQHSNFMVSECMSVKFL